MVLIIQGLQRENLVVKYQKTDKATKRNHRDLLVDVFLTMICRMIQILDKVSKKIVARLCGCCGGFVDTIISVFTQLYRAGCNLEFETLYESM